MRRAARLPLLSLSSLSTHRPGRLGGSARACSSSSGNSSSGGSRWRTGAALLATLGLAGGGAFFSICERFVYDEDFRRWMRAELAVPARAIERFLADHMPRRARALRVSDDLILGEPAELEQRPRRPVGGVTLGGVPTPAAALSEEGRSFYAKFSSKLGDAVQPLQELPLGNAANAAEPFSTPDTLALAAPSSPPAALADSPLGPIAPDDEPEEAADGDECLPNALQWWSPRDDSALTWRSAPPPSDALQLAVPIASADRFDAAMSLFKHECERIAGRMPDVEAGSAGGPIDASPDSTRGGKGPHTPASPELRVIALPEGFATAPEVFYRLAEEAADADVAAVRRLRLQWLRVQEAYTKAEIDALTPRAEEMRAQAANCEGGGQAFAAMNQRLRQLIWRLNSLVDEKKMVKSGQM